MADNIFAEDSDGLSDDRAEAEALDAELDAAIDEMIGRETSDEEDATRGEQSEASDTAPDVSEEDSLAAMKAAIAAASEAVESDEDTADEAKDGSGEEKVAAFEPEEPGDAAFDRILGETNSRMDDSEGNRRRSAIAHLKAAVAATKADRLLKRIKQPEERAAEEQSQYRDDLAKVVRPNRPETEATDEKTERPHMLEDKPSPLMLVSELRVDDGGKDVASIIPRRPDDEGENDVEAEYDQGFAEFAKQMGASALPDLLEAAAAYSAFVEGQKEFSRPQLMRRVSGVGGGDHSREQGLRSFGQLLRQGKIQKLKRGQFTVTTETRFNPEARIAGE